MAVLAEKRKRGRPREPMTAEHVKQYQTRQEQINRHNRALSLVGRDIWPIPDIADTRRRARCKFSFRLFCTTYNPAPFYFGWSKEHLRAIRLIEEAVLEGVLHAFAMARGSGKTLLTRMAALWALSYGHRRYVFGIGATADKGQEALAAIKTWIRFLENYAADFPEISWPVQKLGGIAHRANGQLCREEPTLIEWQKDKIVLATVPPPENWPKKWPLRNDGMVPTSGSVFSTSGLTGEGIRGSAATLRTGEVIRPDFVILDDPSTPEASNSPTQNATREGLIAADVLGMAGPGKSISGVMPCTVIARDDFIDRLLDRKKHPAWRGERTKMLRTMPKNMAEWEKYFEVYRICIQKEPPDHKAANDYYIEHREALDEGAEASWPQRKKEQEISAIQHAMNIYCERGVKVFMAEYQNDPMPAIELLPDEITADKVMARINQHDRGLVPNFAQRLTAFIDVQKDLLFFCVCGWNDVFDGAVLDYGTFPRQNRHYFALRDANPTLSAATGIGSEEGSIWAGLDRLTDDLLGRDWKSDSGGVLRVERCLIDSGYKRELIVKFCRQSKHATVVMPSKGFGLGAAKSPIDDWPVKPGERRGLNWIVPVPKPGEGRVVNYDTHFWKSFIASRLAQPMGEKGSLTIFGTDKSEHRLFADHLTAEYRVRTQGRGREVDEWQLRPHRPDNHWLDCIIGAAVAASIQGAALMGMGTEPVKRRRKLSIAEMRQRR